jgi:hypothetical protein
VQSEQIEIYGKKFTHTEILSVISPNKNLLNYFDKLKNLYCAFCSDTLNLNSELKIKSGCGCTLWGLECLDKYLEINTQFNKNICFCANKLETNFLDDLQNQKEIYNKFSVKCMYCLKDKDLFLKCITLKLREKDSKNFNKCFNMQKFTHIICDGCINLYFTE